LDDELRGSSMIKKYALCAGFLFMVASVYGQNAANWPCSEDPTKAVRVSLGVMQTLAQNKALPDVSDLKGKKINSTVILQLIIGKDGSVRCAVPVRGDADLFPRSLEAARQWRFKPLLLNGQPLIVATMMEFVFKKGKVMARAVKSL
jgi:hypothetical protein